MHLVIILNYSNSFSSAVTIFKFNVHLLEISKVAMFLQKQK